MERHDAFQTVFSQLRSVLDEYTPALRVEADAPGAFALNTPYSEKWKKELSFAGVQVRKSYVSYHLFPVYMYPELLSSVDDGLKARMQGKSCFNFKRLTPAQLEQLRSLTRTAYEKIRQEGLA